MQVSIDYYSRPQLFLLYLGNQQDKFQLPSPAISGQTYFMYQFELIEDNKKRKWKIVPFVETFCKIV